MGEADETRLIAWGREMRAAHDRLRDALEVARGSVAEGAPQQPLGADLVVFCRGFCAALSGHHAGEDTSLFPLLETEHPDLADVLAKLRQDHSMIEYLVTALDAAAQRTATRGELERHLEGIGAIMESHFVYEERQLLTVLEALDLDADPRSVFGPL